METWLKPNLRILRIGLLISVCALFIGVIVTFYGMNNSSFPGVNYLGYGLTGLGIWLTLSHFIQLSQCLVGYRDGYVYFFVNKSIPVCVPIEVVEAFFQGQKPVRLPGTLPTDAQNVTVVARLAENALEWKKHKVNPKVANWCDGYITIHGTACEPLNTEVINRMNRLLHEKK